MRIPELIRVLLIAEKRVTLASGKSIDRIACFLPTQSNPKRSPRNGGSSQRVPAAGDSFCVHSEVEHGYRDLYTTEARILFVDTPHSADGLKKSPVAQVA